MNINKEMCSLCQGVCCKRTGCMYLPEDFESLEYEYLKSRIDEGFITIAGFYHTDFLHADEWTYILFLKARNIEQDIVDFTGNKSKCRMLTDTGCGYDDENRPSYGKSLIPTRVGGPCKQPIGRYETRREWTKYQEVLNKLVFHYTNQLAYDYLMHQNKILNDEFINIVIKGTYYTPKQTDDIIEDYLKEIRKHSRKRTNN